MEREEVRRGTEKGARQRAEKGRGDRMNRERRAREPPFNLPHPM
jgi:hypothetical protein